MFNTFKYDPETRQVQQLRSGFDPVTARSNQHQACNNCHVKKLRCSGDKSGCDRCIASSLVCEYTRSSSRSSRSSRRAGSGSGKKRSSSNSGPASDASPSSGAQSRMRTPSPTHLPARAQGTSTPRPHASQPAAFDFGTAPRAGPGGGPPVDARAFAEHFSQSIAGIADPLLATAPRYEAGGAAGYDFPQAGAMWQPSAAMASLSVNPPFLGAPGMEAFASPEDFLAMYPEFAQYSHGQNLEDQYWQGGH